MVQTITFLVLGVSIGTFLGSLYMYKAAKDMRKQRQEVLKEKYGYRVGEAIWKGSDFETLKAAVEQKEKYDE